MRCARILPMLFRSHSNIAPSIVYAMDHGCNTGLARVLVLRTGEAGSEELCVFQHYSAVLNMGTSTMILTSKNKIHGRTKSRRRRQKTHTSAFKTNSQSPLRFWKGEICTAPRLSQAQLAMRAKVHKF